MAMKERREEFFLQIIQSLNLPTFLSRFSVSFSIKLQKHFSLLFFIVFFAGWNWKEKGKFSIAQCAQRTLLELSS